MPPPRPTVSRPVPTDPRAPASAHKIPRRDRGRPQRARTTVVRHNCPMSDNDVTQTHPDQVIHIEDVLAAAPIEPGKLGRHTVLSPGGIKVIVLAFASGQVMKEHRSHHPLLLQALDGHVRVTTAERTVELLPGGLLYLPNALAHSLEALEPSRVSLTPIGI